MRDFFALHVGQDAWLPVDAFSVLHDLFLELFVVHELNVVLDALKLWERHGVVHNVLPIGAELVACIVLVVLENQLIVEAEVRALEIHIVRVDSLTHEGISVVLHQKLVEVLVCQLHPTHVRVEHDLLGRHIFVRTCFLRGRSVC